MQNYLIVARSGRSLAESAKRAGYSVHVLDSFADQDTRQSSVSVKQIQYGDNGFSENQLIKSIQDILKNYPATSVVVGSGFEHNPELIKKISDLTTVYSNTVETIKMLKTKAFFSLLDECEINYPETLFKFPARFENTLIKKTAGMGGEHVQWLSNQSDAYLSDYYCQKYIKGIVSSVVFLADGNSSTIIGYNRQWQSKKVEAMPFLYGGCCRIPSVRERYQKEISRIVNRLVKHCCLKGMCGIDYILTDEGDIYVLEVNPRPPASFELHEDSNSLFAAHIASFNGDLEKFEPERCKGYRAYAILYADLDLHIPTEFEWPDWVKDRPVADTKIKKYWPVCTIHAEKSSWSDINMEIESRRKQIESRLYQ